MRPPLQPVNFILRYTSILMIELVCLSCSRSHEPSIKDAGIFTESDFYGVWIIDSDSLRKLPSFGFKKYMEASCHMIKLNPDGTCVYRAYSDYPDFHGDTELQTREYEDFFMEGTRYGFRYESWYLWRSNDANPQLQLSGPFESRPDPAGGAVCKNKWPRWRLVDWNKWGNNQRANMGERYSIQFHVTLDDTPKMGTHWTVRKVDEEPRLVQWAGHAGDTISLRKFPSRTAAGGVSRKETNEMTR